MVPGDRAALVELFAQCFPPVPGRQPPLSLDDWNWKYGATPPSCSSLVEDVESGAVLAHVGGICADAEWGDERFLAVQCTDHMVDPRFEGGLVRGRLFLSLMLHWTEQHCTAGRRIVAWGVPSAANRVVGAKYVGYGDLGGTLCLVLPVASVERSAVDLGALRGAGGDALPEWCGSLQLEPGAFRLTRSNEYLDWRYRRRPRSSYGWIALPSRAAAVFQPGGLAADCLHVLEWLMDPRDAEARECTLRALADEARTRGLEYLSFWCARRDPLAPWLVGHGARRMRTHMVPTGRSRCGELPFAALVRAWRPSQGDLDLL